jgi:uncharacterized repeat protein (TIGR01451 family)/uncharacterized repeat protein (TIGR02543 family)
MALLLAAIPLFGIEPAIPAAADATITVTSTLDGTVAALTGNGTCELREAIAAANTDSVVGECAPGNGTDTILFADALTAEGDAYIVLVEGDSGTDDGEFGPTAFLITTTVVIRGPASENGVVIWGSFASSERRIFHVTNTGDLTLESLTLTQGIARGGNGGHGTTGGGGAAGLGGAILNQGTLTIRNSTFTGNQALGGHGQANGGQDGGGGGGGVGTNGLDAPGPHTASTTRGAAGGGPNGGTGGQTHGADGADAGNGGGGGGGAGGWCPCTWIAGSGGNGGFGGGGGGGGYALATGGGSKGTGGDGGDGGFGGGGGGAGPAQSFTVVPTTGLPGDGGYGGGRGGTAGTGSAGNGGSGGGGAGFGGAIFNNAGTVTIESSTFSANLAWGGSSYNSEGSNQFDNGDGGSAAGGAIFNRNGTVSILNSTIVSNTAAGGGGDAEGAVLSAGVFSLANGDDATLTMNNTIVANSILAQSAFEDFQLVLNATGDANDVAAGTFGGGTTSTTGTNNLIELHSGLSPDMVLSSSDPNLGDLQDNTGPTTTHAPNAGSPVIDSGDCGAATQDQRGVTRPLDGEPNGSTQCDIGAVEYDPTLDPVAPPTVVDGLEGDVLRASDMGPDGDTSYFAAQPAVAYNATNREYLIVWYGDDTGGDLVDNEVEIFGQRIDADTGAEIEGDFRISDMGPDGSIDYRGQSPRVAWNATNNEYLVVWQGDDNTAPLIDNEFEIFGQRINADGTQIEGNFRISDMGPDGDTNYIALSPDVVWNSANNEYLVVWYGDDDTAPLVDNEFEIFGQRIDGATGAEIEGDFRISDMGDDAEFDPFVRSGFRAADPRVTYNTANNEYLVVWQGDDDTAPLVDNEFEVFGQRINADGTQIEGNFRISDMGPDGSTSFFVSNPNVTYNPVDNEYLVVWAGDDDTSPLIDDEREIFGQLLAAAPAAEISIAALSEVGENDFAISDAGLPGNTTYGASNPSAAYDATRHEYLVVWTADDFQPPLVKDNEFEVRGQLLAAGTGAAVGVNDFRISSMGPDNDSDYSAFNPDLAANTSNEEYLIVWAGDDNTPPLVNDEREIFAQLFGVPIPQLSIHKSASDATPIEGDTLTYTVVITNSGSATATNAVVTDILPADVVFVPGSTTVDPVGAGTTGDAPTLLNNLEIPSGESVEITYAAIVAGTGLLTNTVSVTSAEVTEPVSASAVVSAGERIYTLTVSIAGDGSGAVSGTPDGIDCGGDCSEALSAGTPVTLTAVAAAGSTFSGWSGGLSGSTNPATIVVDSDKHVTATFTIESEPSYTLTVHVAGDGEVTPTGGAYTAGTVVPVTATASAGWVFSGWSGDLSGSTNPTSILIDGDKNITATFTAESTPSHNLTVNVVGNGSVLPNGGTFTAGTLLPITATSSAGWVFSSWSGDLSGSTNPTTILIDGDKVITATFTEELTTYGLAIHVVGEGSVTPTDGAFTAGEMVPLTATASAGWGFSGWSGDLSGSTNPTLILMDGDKSITANFTLIEDDTEDDTQAGIGVTMSANTTQASVGDTITYTYRITNSGNVTLTAITAADDRLGEIDGLAGELAPNQSRSATVAYIVQASDLPGPLSNTVIVTATGLLDTVATGSAFTSVALSDPTGLPTSPQPNQGIQIYLPHIKSRGQILEDGALLQQRMEIHLPRIESD